MTSSLRARPTLPRRWPLAAAVLGILAAGSGWWLTTHRAPGTEVAPGDQASIDRTVRQLVAGFERSRTYKMLIEGERLPSMSAPVIVGHPQPDWNAPMLITFGGEFAPQIKALHQRLERENVTLQRVHILYNQAASDIDGENIVALNQEKIKEFSPQVSLLDASSRVTPEVAAELKIIGVREAGYAFIRAADSTILYADNTIGLSTQGIYDAVQQFAKGGGQAVKGNSEHPLRISESFPLSNLPGGIEKSLRAESSKSRAVVFFSSADCNICTPWKAVAAPYVQEWKKQGYGVVFVQMDEQKYATQTQSDGSLRIDGLGGSNPERSQLARLWNIRLFPGAYLLQNGKFQGSIPFISLKTDQREYYDIQFKTVQRLLNRDR